MTEEQLYPELVGRDELKKKRAQYIFFSRLVVAMGLLLFTISISILVFNAISSIQTRHALLDCTQPEGSCYQKGQEQTAIVIQQLLDGIENKADVTREIVRDSAVCSSRSENSGNEFLINKCIQQLMKEKGKANG